MSKQPNIIVFVSHDTGRFIGPYGVGSVNTPNANRLASEGALFANSFATSPGCCPSRAGIFSGCAPHTAGILGQTGSWAGFRFSPDVTHASQHFKNLGYDTLLLGGAHEILGAGCPMSYLDGVGFDYLEDERSLFVSGIESRMPALLNRCKGSGKPFYLQIGTQETHTAYLRDGVESYTEKGVEIPDSAVLSDGEGTRQWFADLQGSVNRLDEGLGTVMRYLDDNDLTDNTLLVFTTDHGLPAPREKTTLYDRGIETFLIARLPGVIPAGKCYDELVSNVDILPTLIEAAGGSPPDQIQGRSLLPLMTGGHYTPREALFAEKTFHTSYDPIRCVRTRKYKYIFNFESVRPENYCLDISYKPVLLECIDKLSKRPDRWDELYDLEADPRETNNLAESPDHQDVRHQLATQLAEWMAATADPLLHGPVASPRFYKRTEWLRERIKTE